MSPGSEEQIGQQHNPSLDRLTGVMPRGWSEVFEKYIWESLPDELKNLTVPDRHSGIAAANAEREKIDRVIINVAQKFQAKGLGFAMLPIDLDNLKMFNTKSRAHGDILIRYGIAFTNQELARVYGTQETEDGKLVILMREGQNADEIAAYVFGLKENDMSHLKLSRDNIGKQRYITDKKGDGKGPVKYPFGLSAGLVSTFHPQIITLIKSEGGVNEKVFKAMAKLSQEQVKSQKVIHELENIPVQEIVKDNLLQFINRMADHFGGVRVSKVGLKIVASLAAIKGVTQYNTAKGIEIMEILTGKDNNDSQINQLKKTIFANLVRALNMLSQSETKTIPDQAEKITKPNEMQALAATKDFFKNLSDQLKVRTEFMWDNVNNDLDKDVRARDHKTELVRFSDTARGKIKDQLTTCIRDGLPWVIGMVDANQLKRCNTRFGYSVGDILINWNASYATRIYGETIIGNQKVYIVARDAAGDELILFVPSPTPELIVKLHELTAKINNEKVSIPIEDDVCEFSTSAAIITHEVVGQQKLQKIITETREKIAAGQLPKGAYMVLNEAIRVVDEEVKTLKILKQLQELPIERLINGRGIKDTISFIVEEFGGDRLSKESIKVILKIVAVRAVFDFGLSLETSFDILMEVFKQAVDEHGDQRMSTATSMLFEKLKIGFRSKYGATNSQTNTPLSQDPRRRGLG